MSSSPDWIGALARIKNVFSNPVPVPNTPYPAQTPIVSAAPASPIGHQESPGSGGAFYPGPVLPSGPQPFTNLQTGQPTPNQGLGLASNPDMEARRKYVNDQQRQQQDQDIDNQFGKPGLMGQMRNLLKNQQEQPQQSKPKNASFYGE
jgi:hypothetical protein